MPGQSGPTELHWAMHTFATVGITVILAFASAPPAFAQRIPFERSFELNTPAVVVDVSTLRGKIEIGVGVARRVVVRGEVTVRADWAVPADAPDLARRLANDPPTSREGKTIRLRPPSDRTVQRAVTVSYRVEVPPDTEIVSVSDSGATTIRDVRGAVTVRTGSGAIQLYALGASVGVQTGSGAVTVEGVAGPLTVTTGSSAFVGTGVEGPFRLRTGSGSVDATLAGTGDVDVETGSSAIRLRRVSGALSAHSGSGRLSIDGRPGNAWNASTASGSIAMVIESGAAFRFEATSTSGSVKMTGVTVQGTVSKRKVAGDVHGGGPLVSVTTRSGTVELTLASNSSRSTH